jgi:predicted transcriptional regulator
MMNSTWHIYTSKMRCVIVGSDEVDNVVINIIRTEWSRYQSPSIFDTSGKSLLMEKYFK